MQRERRSKVCTALNMSESFFSDARREPRMIFTGHVDIYHSGLWEDMVEVYDRKQQTEAKSRPSKCATTYPYV